MTVNEVAYVYIKPGSTPPVYRIGLATPGAAKFMKSRTKEELGEVNLTEVRCYGTKDHAGMIVALSRHSKIGLRIGSPRAPLLAGEAPSRLHTMRSYSLLDKLAASTGGWHVPTPGELITYELLDAYRKAGIITDEVISLVRKHPAWPAFSFVGVKDYEPAIAFIQHVVDPRFFVDWNYPDIDGTLSHMLGVSPKAISNVASDTDVFAVPAASVLACWADPGRHGIDAAASHRAWLEDQSFLRRHCALHSDFIGGLYSSCIRFVEFVCSVWLDGMSDKHCLFVPEYFFEKISSVDAVALASAFTSHRHQLSSVQG